MQNRIKSDNVHYYNRQSIAIKLYKNKINRKDFSNNKFIGNKYRANSAKNNFRQLDSSRERNLMNPTLKILTDKYN